MVKYCELFATFFRVGTFTLGGGYAMIPLMRREVVERHAWMDDTSFLDTVALAQTMPGVFAVNMATQVGLRLRGMSGAAVAIAGNILMPIAIILLFATLFRRYQDVPALQHIFMGIRPAVVALIAAPVFTLARSAGVTWRTLWIPVAAALLIWLLGVSPILIVLATIAAGVLYSKIKPEH